MGGFSLYAPTLLGDLQPPKDPSEPVLAGFSTGGNSGLLANETMVAELLGGPPKPGSTMQDRFRAVRTALLNTPFETFERAVRSQAHGRLPAAASTRRATSSAITVNRWPHGFAMSRNSLFDPDTPEHEAPNVIARRKFGHITIANSDASGVDLVQTAFDEAFRAVRELEPQRYGYFERI